jgi:sugar O-acyltransferase (sialic acid O-acetyltransferase NeuD family)
MEIGIYGTGGHAKEVAWLVSDLVGIYAHVAFIDDNKTGELRGTPILSWGAFRAAHPHAEVAFAIGDPATRERLSAKSEAATVIHPSSVISPLASLGEGAIIFCGAILTVDVALGRHVHINVGATISHDVRIGDFVTISPGVHISGNVHIGKRVYIGTGANIINGTPDSPLVIGDGAYIAAGACITKSCDPRSLYAGVPAVLKKRY